MLLQVHVCQAEGMWAMKAREWALGAMIALVAAGCGREDAAPAIGPAAIPAAVPGDAAPAVDVVPPDRPPALEDVMERDPRFVVGISYPPAAKQYPGLAAELEAFAGAARADLDQAVASLGEGRPRAPYDLVLDFAMRVETPRVVAVAADGSSYTGGAHGNPLVARFVWLPEEQRMLTARELMADAEGWRVLSAYVREQLHAALFQRVDDDGSLDPDERAQLVRSGGQMIEEGSTPEAGNFEHFEPLMDANGRIQALRFVFPPYQVGPYSDGTRTVVVPADVLLPYVAAGYRGLFSGG